MVGRYLGILQDYNTPTRSNSPSLPLIQQEKLSTIEFSLLQGHQSYFLELIVKSNAHIKIRGAWMDSPLQ
jgi:hypothetical protein